MFQIIANESEFLVISKSANVHFHSQDGNPGLVVELVEEIGFTVYPVHRLDTITSGLLLFAKSPESAKKLSALFSNHAIEKYYVALATGKPKKKQGTIIGDMAKSRRGKYKLLRTRNNPAITRFFSHSIGPGMRLYLLSPLSGKTHQLRVAMASLGTPVLGDSRYGGDSADRGYLHAWHLAFEFEKKTYQFYAEPIEGELYQQQVIMSQLEQWKPPGKLAWP